MSPRNDSAVTEFLILGFSDLPGLRVPLFLLFLLVYLFTLAGNLLILAVICTDSHLHTPMYFFLCNLSVLDASSSSVSLPKLLDILATQNKSIAFSACMLQQYFCSSLTATEYFLLAAMAYDRYAAICDPLHYTVLMSKKLSALLAAGCWVSMFLDSAIFMVFFSRLDFCGANQINHVFCDIAALVQLACSNTRTVELYVLVQSVLIMFGPFLLTLASYGCIVAAILKIRSAEGRRKAFSTCSSHLTVVILFYVTLFCMYMRPKSMFSADLNKIFALLYTALIPMLNPMIYSLRNKDVKDALVKLCNRCSKKCLTYAR
ncbi:olfactory receptor 5B21-like [Rhinatrema bivittatum]|uniref:olfactory receptor 5B21-like n=1 Tax=Rhinatrema bivittatum TaxID=194408 RepID=UPI00112915F4|nr:olfactory receptor 5B21-like [Rhinatrema bivittatum]